MAPDFFDPYDSDVLSNDPHREGPNATRPHSTRVHLGMGMVLEDVVDLWVGTVVYVEKSGGAYLVELKDRRGRTRPFPSGTGFWLEGRPIITFPPRPTPIEQAKSASGLAIARGQALTGSGSIATPKLATRVTRASRIQAEGRHDAELTQRAWGDDLAETDVVIQLLEGVDKLEEVPEVFGPNDQVRAGVLVDHLAPGSKESRVAEAATRHRRESVLVLDCPYVDIWQAVRPSRLGLEAWPQIERGIDIKHGTLEALGWPHENQVGTTMGWKRILSRVRSYRDLESALLGRVEELIGFMTVPGLSQAPGPKLRGGSIIGTQK